jgi:hypothetical protein
MKREFIWRILLFLLFAIFFLSSLGYLHIVDKIIDYNTLSGFFGINEKAMTNNALYAGIVIGIYILFLIAEAVVLAFSFFRRKENKHLGTIQKINKFLRYKTDNVAEQAIKLAIALFLAVILGMIFISVNIFECYTVPISRGIVTYCGRPEQLAYLMISIICLAHAVLPLKVIRRNKD